MSIESLLNPSAALVEAPISTVYMIAAGASGVSAKPPLATMPSITPTTSICADGEPPGKTAQGKAAHSPPSRPAWSAPLRMTPGPTRVGALPR